MRNIKKIWIVGANGRLGQAINDLLDRREVEVLNTDIDDVDITDSESLMLYGDMNRPDIIINCAGLTDVEVCEREIERAYKVNALGARNLSIVAFKIGAKLIHISTDDVFSGESNVPYSEFDLPHPKSVYGKSKLAGESFVKDFVNKYIIIRSSWVYGTGENFVKDLLELAKTQDTIQIADNQYGAPTSAVELAKLVIYLMNTTEYGLYHGTCEGYCSRYEFAKEVLDLAGAKAKLEAVSTKRAELASKRPAYCVLDNFMLRISGGYKMPSWQGALADYIKKLG